MKRVLLGVVSALSVLGVFAHEKLTTVWGEKVTADNAWRMYPRPEMVRENWTSLNGSWNFGLGKWYEDELPKCDAKILVPFPVESLLSGVEKLVEPTDVMVYERRFTAAKRANERTLLHFESVDYRAQVFVNGIEVTDVPHEGYSIPFELDITAALKDGENELRVVAWDPTNEGIQAVGKQHHHPQQCFYTRTSGIMGSVWLEQVPKTYVKGYKVVTDFVKGTATVTVELAGGPMTATDVEIKVLDGESVVASASTLSSMPVEIKLPAGFKAWSPENPFLYTLGIKVKDKSLAGDEVKGYFGMRTIERKNDAKGVPSFFLNGKKIYILATLDQGWWPDGLLTPPSEEAMLYDIEVLRKAGYNAIRKHIKVEPRRFYYDCDRLGMLLVQDMPSGNAIPSDDTVKRTGVEWVEWNDPWRIQRYNEYRREFMAMLDHLQMHPSIIMWAPYNECWGMPNRSFSKLTYDWANNYDPTRLYDGPSGWWDWWEGGILGPGQNQYDQAKIKGDIAPCDAFDRHDYDAEPKMKIYPNGKRVAFLGEMGGLSHKVKDHMWLGDAKMEYRTLDTREALLDMYAKQGEAVRKLAAEGLGGNVYTQTTDVEDEYNGLMTYDRRVIKFDLGKLKKIHEAILKAAEGRE